MGLVEELVEDASSANAGRCFVVVTTIAIRSGSRAGQGSGYEDVGGEQRGDRFEFATLVLFRSSVASRSTARKRPSAHLARSASSATRPPQTSTKRGGSSQENSWPMASTVARTAFFSPVSMRGSRRSPAAGVVGRLASGVEQVVHFAGEPGVERDAAATRFR